MILRGLRGRSSLSLRYGLFVFGRLRLRLPERRGDEGSSKNDAGLILPALAIRCLRPGLT